MGMGPRAREALPCLVQALAFCREIWACQHLRQYLTARAPSPRDEPLDEALVELHQVLDAPPWDGCVKLRVAQEVPRKPFLVKVLTDQGTSLAVAVQWHQQQPWR
eukprot:6089016-Alexandrium_andersonii.AAC.1